MSKIELVEGAFSWDNEDTTFKGWHDPFVRWNGFAAPAFERAEADRLMAFHNTAAKDFPEMGTLTFDADQDAYLLDESANYPGEPPEVFHGFTRDGKRLYAIGAFGWTWMEVE